MKSAAAHACLCMAFLGACNEPPSPPAAVGDEEMANLAAARAALASE